MREAGRREYGETCRGACARHGLAGTQAHSRLSAAHWPRAVSDVAGPARDGPRCHGAGVLCQVEGTVRPVAE